MIKKAVSVCPLAPQVMLQRKNHVMCKNVACSAGRERFSVRIIKAISEKKRAETGERGYLLSPVSSPLFFVRVAIYTASHFLNALEHATKSVVLKKNIERFGE